MPELIEVELYRSAAERTIGRAITAVHTPDPWFLKDGLDGSTASALVGLRVASARRHGKLLVLDLSDTTRLGLRFGMTGRLVVDGEAPVDELLYGPARTPNAAPHWVRFALDLDGGRLELVDPRRLGGVTLDPDESALGPDAATLRVAELRPALESSRALKAVLLDQSRVAGLGNLLVDETLWRAGLDPTRPADGLSSAEQRALAQSVTTTVRLLSRRGGSHLGDLQDSRERGGACPRCGSALTRATVGGRTTYWCPAEQE